MYVYIYIYILYTTWQCEFIVLSFTGCAAPWKRKAHNGGLLARVVAGVFELVLGVGRPELKKIAAAGPKTPVSKVVTGRRRMLSMAVQRAECLRF